MTSTNLLYIDQPTQVYRKHLYPPVEYTPKSTNKQTTTKKERKRLKPSNAHQCIPDGNNNNKRNQTRRYAARQKVANAEVALASAGDFHHDGGCIVFSQIS